MTKILLILDLDQTLIHTSEAPLDNIEATFSLSPYHYVYLRPYLKEFLYTCTKHFELAIWSSAKRDYVHQVVNKIIPQDIPLSFVWSRKKCTFGAPPLAMLPNDEQLQTSKVWFKKLEKVKKQGYSLHKVLIVDNSPEKVFFDRDNAIYINDFCGETNDQDLIFLSKYLPTLCSSEDVRCIDKKNWKENGF